MKRIQNALLAIPVLFSLSMSGLLFAAQPEPAVEQSSESIKDLLKSYRRQAKSEDKRNHLLKISKRAPKTVEEADELVDMIKRGEEGEKKAAVDSFDRIQESDQQMIPAVVKMLDDSDDRVVMAAVEASQKLKPRQARKKLLKHARRIARGKLRLRKMDAEDVIGERAFGALLLMKDDSMMEDLLNMCEDNPELTEWVVKSYGGKTLNSIVRRANASSDREILEKFSRGISQIKDEAELPELIRLAKDSTQKVEVRTGAIGAIGNIGTPKAVDEIMKVYDAEPISTIKLKILQSLENNSHPKYRPFLKKVAKDDNNDTLRSAAINAMGPFSDSNDIPFLEEIVKKERYREPRDSAATVLSKITGKSFSSVLEELLPK